ncbi:TPA: type II toxin-antitoxin system RelE/ParE family toxin [Morganella morganii]|nr:type II toxin-antitoxin system RelE/ParE family toxin [Morganella morganii]
MYKLTERAVNDFAGIYDYTLLNFGETQADRYTDAFEAFFETLAGIPDMGRDSQLLPEILRIEFQRHTIFYTIRETDILIVRILHQQMNHARHFSGTS